MKYHSVQKQKSRWLPWQIKTYLILLSTMLSLFISTAHGREVYYPRPESAEDPRAEYPRELLALALAKADVDYELKPNAKVLPQQRALLYLAKEKQMHVVWTMTNVLREQNFLPIRIPIYKGLIGWRIPLIKNSNRVTKTPPQTLNELLRYSVLQGSDWPDKTILEANGVKVHHTYQYENLFEMLKVGRADMFLRSIVEIWPEAESHKEDEIVVEQGLLVHYPTAFYYFVHKDNITLANTIEKGLLKSIEDGSFDALFRAYLQRPLEKSQLNKRQVISLKNPFLPDATPIDNKKLWHHVLSETSAYISPETLTPEAEELNTH